MPLDEDGAKWSCEPCVRGHRSSKCQHFDRLMMKVPKAGRPLAKCPHPKGSCSCKRTYAFMVRIPKGSSCLCRPLYQVSATSDESVANNTALSANMIPQLVSNKIQKHSQRKNSVQMNTENVLQGLNMATDCNAAGMSSGDPALPLQHRQYDPPSTESTFTAVFSGQDPHGAAAVRVADSCCSRRIASEPNVQPLPSCCDQKKPLGEAIAVCEKERKTCCNNSDREVTHAVTESQPSQTVHWKSTNVHGMYDATGWTGSQSSMYPFLQNSLPRDSRIPLEYHNGNHFVDNINHGPSVGDMHPLSFPAVSSTGENGNSFITSTSLPNEDLGGCHCGDGCQCLGCATHPYNQTTRQHVEEMGYMMSIIEEDANCDQASPFSLHSTAYPRPLSPDSTPMPQILPMDESQFALEANVDGRGSVYDNNTMPLAHHQLMHPSEYYTLEYPVGLPGVCSNMNGTCQCGNDCSCLGCITHSGHNGVQLEDQLAAESTSKDSPNDTNSNHQFGVDLAVMRRQSLSTADGFSFSPYIPRALKTSSS